VGAVGLDQIDASTYHFSHTSTEALLSQNKWTVTFRIHRQKEGGQPHFDDFRIEVDPNEFVLDGVERVWAFHDRSLAFRHACHHSTCGACGMRVNGVEKLTCITPIHEVTHDGGTLVVEPLRNFPILSDLVVDTTSFYALMDAAEYPAVAAESATPRDRSIRPAGGEDDLERLNDCIECGLCVSACPIATTTATYLGPAVLAGAQFTGVAERPEVLDLVDNQDGLWRCHSAYACSQVCPSFVEPGSRIMDLRRQTIAQRFQRLFHAERK
jgi:succinate dehydrogenase / fumarate reductase iron-sulfur subunit